MNNHRLNLVPVHLVPRRRVSGLTYSATNAWMGTASNDSSTGNYHLAEYKTSARGWNERVLDPTGTITRREFDGLGRTLSVWTGTDDTPSRGFWSPRARVLLSVARCMAITISVTGAAAG